MGKALCAGGRGADYSAVAVAIPAAPAEQRRLPDVQLPISKPVAPAKPSADTVSRGQLLYENHCVACHESVVHVRHDRRAKSYQALEDRVKPAARSRPG